MNHQADLIKSYFINNYKNLNINYIKKRKNHLEQLENSSNRKKINLKIYLFQIVDTLFKIDYADFYFAHKKEKNIS